MDCILQGNNNFTDISWHEPENEDTNKLFRYKMIIDIPINKNAQERTKHRMLSREQVKSQWMNINNEKVA